MGLTLSVGCVDINGKKKRGSLPKKLGFFCEVLHTIVRKITGQACVCQNHKLKRGGPRKFPCIKWSTQDTLKSSEGAEFEEAPPVNGINTDAKEVMEKKRVANSQRKKTSKEKKRPQGAIFKIFPQESGCGGD